MESEAKLAIHGSAALFDAVAIPALKIFEGGLASIAAVRWEGCSAARRRDPKSVMRTRQCSPSKYSAGSWQQSENGWVCHLLDEVLRDALRGMKPRRPDCGLLPVTAA